MTQTSSQQDSITITWHIDDVKEIRPDLTDDQCRKVLQASKRHHNAEIGINWITLQVVADENFPLAEGGAA